MRRVMSTLCTAVALSASLCAQDISGNLEAVVLDTAGVPVVGANISVESPSLQGLRGATSDERGFFHILSLPPGRYTARISHVAHRTTIVNDVRVGLGLTTGLGEIGLQPQSLEFAEVVTTAERQLLDPKSTTTGGNLLLNDVTALPMERIYRSVAFLLPNVNQSFYGDEASLGGATGGENRYFINGTDVTDPYQGIGGINLPYNFIREVQVRVGGYEPEYRSSLGGTMNVVTYSGGNDLSGSVFGFFTNNSLSSPERVLSGKPPKGGYSMYDVGVSLGGPIVRDRLWYFVAYSPSFRNEDVALPGLGYYPDLFRSDLAAGKLTWKASESVDLAATVIADPTTEESVGRTFSILPFPLKIVNPDPYLAKVTTGGIGIILDGQCLLGNATLLQGSMSWTSRSARYMPRTEIGATLPWYYDNESGTASGGYPERIDNRSAVVSASMAATFPLGSHTVKTGIQYKDQSFTANSSFATLMRTTDTSFFVKTDLRQGTLHNRLPSAFIQDSWELNRYLRINGGIRWDGLFIIGSDGTMAQQVLDQFQPRLGVVFLPRGDGALKLYITAGRFAQDLLMAGSTLYHMAGTHILLVTYPHDPRLDPSGSDTISILRGSVQKNVPYLRGQYGDEVTVGYEQAFESRTRLSMRGIYRTLREIMEDSEYPPGSGTMVYANPGHDPLTAYSSPRREYLALELSLQTSLWRSLDVLASYVLSRDFGNYNGLYWEDVGIAMPNTTSTFDYPDLMNNATGLLPSDRTHVLKVNASYRSTFGLNVGVSWLWQSGTPFNEFGMSAHGPYWPIFLQPRGTAGRLPSISDVNLRFSYEHPGWKDRPARPRLILDVFHLSNQRTVVRLDQSHYFNQDAQGNQTDRNPNYGNPLNYMPPRSFRLGLEVSF